MFVALVLAAASALFGRRMATRKPVITASAAARVARFASLLFGGLFAGFLVAVLVLDLSLRRFGASVYTQVRHIELIGWDVLASATLLPALVATAFLVVVEWRRGRASWPARTALVLLVLVFALSSLVNLPINAEQLAWSVQMPPGDWTSTRDRWQLSHVVRTGAAVLALGCLAAAASVTGERSPLRGAGHRSPSCSI
ncbi:anthrone oxygenase family protein [Pseudonocardia sichuanensis]